MITAEERIIRSEKIKEYEVYLMEQEKSLSTIRKYIQDIKRMYKYFEEKELSKILLIEWKKLLAESYSASSVNTRKIYFAMRKKNYLKTNILD